jgi:dipeptidyl aminopeptidase/acylaminoacyl peptidase
VAGGVALAVGFAAAAAPTPPRLVVFVQLVDNGMGADSNATVYVATLGSTRARQLSDSCIDCADAPRFSPDGRWIAFQSEQPSAGIFVIRPDGSGLRRICGTPKTGPNCEDNPAWSPDGKRLAFSLYRGGIGIQSITGGRMTRVPGTRHYYGVTGLDWSRRGGQLAFESGYDAVNIIGVDGSHPRRIAGGRTPGALGYGAMGPRFSPDSQRLSFIANDFHALYIYNRVRPRTTTSYPLQVNMPSWWDNQHLFYDTNHGFYVYDLTSGRATWVGPLPDVCKGHGRYCVEFDLQPSGTGTLATN